MKNNEILLTSGFGQFHTNEPDPKKPNKKLTPYVTIGLKQIRALVDKPQQVDKSEAQWLIPSTTQSRNYKEQEKNGSFWCLAADMDDHPPYLDDLAILIEGIIGECDYELFSSRSATNENKKARVIIPLSAPLSGAKFIIAQQIFNNKLEALGVIPDRVTERAAQIHYLPNMGVYYGTRTKREGIYFSPSIAWANEIAVKRAMLDAEQVVLNKAKELAIEKRAALSLSNEPNIIEAFNQAYTPDEFLLDAGYCQQGNKFRHPNSQTGNYSASVKDGRVNTLSSADPLYSDGKGARDAFDVFKVLKHGGDHKAALKDAGDNWLAIGGVSYNKAVQMEYAKNKAPENLARQKTKKPGTVSEKFNKMLESEGTPEPEPDTTEPQNKPKKEPQPKTDFQKKEQAKKNEPERPYALKFTCSDGDTIADNAKPTEYLINNILETDSHGILCGASMSFKTFVALRMAHSICTGKSFFGNEVYTTGKALIICGEGMGALARRIKALKIVDGDFNGNLRLLDQQHIRIDDQEHMDTLRQLIEEFQPIFVVLDTFASLVSSTDENSNGDVGRVQRLVKEACRNEKASSTIIHHLGKDANRGPRGAGGFTDNVDFSWGMERAGDSMLTTLSCIKQKNGENFASIVMEARVVKLGLIQQDGTESSSLILKPTTERPEIKAVKLDPRDKNILTALFEATKNYGIDPPPEVIKKFENNPQDCPKKVVDVIDFRPLAYPCLNVAEKSHKTTLNRSLIKLESVGKAMYYAGYVWAVSSQTQDTTQTQHRHK